MAIHVDEGAITTLKNALELEGENYRQSYSRLQALIDEITRGDIQGDPATELLNKFKAKEEIFKQVLATIDEAEEYMGLKNTKFTRMIGDIKVGMK